MRAEYESRFSRRMSFEDYRRNIEVVTDPALVERWKEEARTTTSIVTREGEPPTVLQSESDARAHFRQHHLDTLLRMGKTFKVHGSIARNPARTGLDAGDPARARDGIALSRAVRPTLAPGVAECRVAHLQASQARRVRLARASDLVFTDGVVTESVAAILDTVAKTRFAPAKCWPSTSSLGKRAPGSNRSSRPSTPPAAVADETVTAAEPPQAAEANPPTESAAPAEASAPVAAQPAPSADDPLAKEKAGLAADLRFLVQSGHLIEFHNGTFDLPLPPKPKDEPSAKPAPTAKIDPRRAS